MNETSQSVPMMNSRLGGMGVKLQQANETGRLQTRAFSKADVGGVSDRTGRMLVDKNRSVT